MKKITSAKKVKTVSIKSSDFGQRVPTGIPGFDELVNGGLPKSSTVLVCGGPGTGKSILCEQFLVNGAEKYGEKGLYVTFEQRKDEVIAQAKQFGWDIESLERRGLLTVMAIPVNKISKKLIDEIRDKIKKEGIKRLVVDSLSTLIINAPIYVSSKDMSVEDVVGENTMFSPPVVGEYFVQKFLYSFIDELRELKDCTSLLIGEADQSGKNISRDTLSEFACDGIILISFESLGGEYSRSLIVRKMRHTKNNEDVHPMEIGKNGIVIHSLE